MYQFSENINYDQFFWFDKKLIRNFNWAMLPKSSKSIFPVIAAHCDVRGNAFPGERTIAIMSGRSDKTTREGVRGLEALPGFTINHYITKRGKKAKKFHLRLPKRNDRGSAFPFHRAIIDGGNWHELKPSAMALYPVMRYFGFFEIEVYFELEDPEGDTAYGNFEKVYRSRRCDYCEAEITLMAKLAGISRQSVPGALRDLETHGLIQSALPNSFGVPWKVFLIPPHYYKRAYLNRKIMKAYRHEMK